MGLRPECGECGECRESGKLHDGCGTGWFSLTVATERGKTSCKLKPRESWNGSGVGRSPSVGGPPGCDRPHPEWIRSRVPTAAIYWGRRLETFATGNLRHGGIEPVTGLRSLQQGYSFFSFSAPLSSAFSAFSASSRSSNFLSLLSAAFFAASRAAASRSRNSASALATAR